MERPDHRGLRDRTVARLRTGMAWFTVGSYTFLAPFGCALFALLCLAWRRDPLLRARRLQAVTVKAYRFMHDWLRLVRIIEFDHRRPIPGLPAGACVVISNHPTLTDITSITAVLGGGCTIVKPAMFNRPLLHGLLVGAGHMEGPSSDPVSMGRVVDEAVAKLRQGFPLIVFPEGTRSREDGLLPFGRAAFEIACRADVPVVSLTVESDPLYLSKGVPVLEPPHPTSRLRLGLLAVDEPRECQHNSRLLRQRIEGRYREWYAAGSFRTTPIDEDAPHGTATGRARESAEGTDRRDPGARGHRAVEHRDGSAAVR